MLEGGRAWVGVELIGRLRWQAIDHVLNRANPTRIIDEWLHVLWVEQPSLVVRVLHIGRCTILKEVEAETAPALGRIEIANGVLALDLFTLQELRDFVHLLPGLWHSPFTLMTFGLPSLGQFSVREIVGAIVEVMAIAVNRNAVGLAIPRADRRLEVIGIIFNIDLLLDPIRHDRGKALAAHIAFERCAHFKNVEIDGLGGNRLLEPRVIIGLRKVDPVDLSACIGFPRL